MRTERGTGPGRRTWRAAVVLFLTVFLGGLGLTGAAALWSQSGQVTAEVETGYLAGFPMPLTMTTQVVGTHGIAWRTHELTWAGPAGPRADEITYRVDAQQTGSLRLAAWSSDVLSQGPATRTTFTTTRPVWPFGPESIQITVTPFLDGVPGTPTVQELWLAHDDRSWLTDP